MISWGFTSQTIQADNYIDAVFVVLYGMAEMYPLLLMTTFLRDEEFGNARHKLGKMKRSVPFPPSPNIKEMNAGRKLRQAEADFVTLKNLYDNGLITEEIFSQRKADLKAALSNNEICSTSNESSMPE